MRSIYGGEDSGSYRMVPPRDLVVVSEPFEGIEWDYDTRKLILTLINPERVPVLDIPIDYSVAYAEILPPGVCGCQPAYWCD